MALVGLWAAKWTDGSSASETCKLDFKDDGHFTQVNERNMDFSGTWVVDEDKVRPYDASLP